MSLTVESGCKDCEAAKYSTPEGAVSIDACVDCQPGKKGDIAITGAVNESFCKSCDPQRGTAAKIICCDI